MICALLATYRRRRAVDHTINGFALFGLGTPPFWLALIVLLVFFGILDILPGPEGRLSPRQEAPPEVTRMYTIDALLAGQLGTFFDAGKHLLLPALVLGFAP